MVVGDGSDCAVAGARMESTACMINYNGEAYLERSLQALTGEGLPLKEVVLVDNASTDGSRAFVAARFPQVRLVEMPGNLGPAAARNAALELAGTDLVVLIDSDVALAPGTLEKLAEALDSDPEAVTAMPTILHGEDDRIIQYDGADAHFLGQQILHHEGEAWGTVPMAERELGSVVSACILVDRSRLPGHGGAGGAEAPFDEDFFIYFEDHDFAYRMRAMGRRVLAVPSAFCHHDAGTPEVSIRALGSYSPLRVFCHIRNRWLFILKNYSARTLLVLAPILVLYEILQVGAVVKKGWMKEWVRSVWWVARHARSLYRKRRHVQRGRRIPDGALLVGGPVPLRAEATPTGFERAARRLLDRMADRYWRLAGGLI